MTSMRTEHGAVSSVESGRERRAGVNDLVRAWWLTGVVDGLWAVALTFAYGRSQARLWQGIAATPFGKTMFDRGWETIALGIAMHFSVALFWSAMLFLLVTRWRWLRDVLASTHGAMKVAAVYGPMIWIVMSLAVIPLLSGTPTVITWRWWVQLAGHVVFVGLPMAWALKKS
jgi:hypothetical protein